MPHSVAHLGGAGVLRASVPTVAGRHAARSGAWALVVVILVAAAAGGAYLGAWQWRQHHPGPQPRPTTRPPAAALAAASVAPPGSTARAAPIPGLTALASALQAPLADPRLGKRTLVEVRDASSGRVLFDHGGSMPAAPASTAKLATALAMLTVHKATDRITTRVVSGVQPGTVVLVGGGDPTLTAAPTGHDGAYADAARVTDLARQLPAANINRILVDGSRYAGAAVSPFWAPEDVPSDYAAPITAAMVDGGRDQPDATTRSAAPDLAAARALAAALGKPGLPISRGTAPADAPVLGSVRSAPIGTLVAQMLATSDNVIAESLARQVALAEHRPATFAGGVSAVRQVVRGLGVDIGIGMRDGSGLAATDRISPETLTRLLRLATGPSRPSLHEVIGDLPIAGWSGTLAARYTAGSATGGGAGLVRAKTGTLTSVSALAGVVHDTAGRLLVFAVIADRVGAKAKDTEAAEAAIDRVAATLARCGCR
jgi:D-alanyl-D-alanine carboxypeptidase/D-alanyl-D-alanine-endopeptidase (penicillin-binding protein 4)